MSTTGNVRDDAQRVARLDGSLFTLQVPDVFVVQLHVDEVTQPAIVRIQVSSQPLVAVRQVRQQLANGAAADLNRLLLVGERAERRRDVNRVRHRSSLPGQKRNGHRAAATRSSLQAHRRGPKR